MANFCSKCGTRVSPDARFCPNCGNSLTGAPESANSTAPRDPAPEGIPQQTGRQPCAPAHSSAAEKRKSGKGGLVFLVLIVLIGVIGYAGFINPGFLKTLGGGSKTAYRQLEMKESLLDYAQQLEDAGNEAAATMVYSLLGKGEGGCLIRRTYEDIPVLHQENEMDQITDLFGGGKEGEGQ